METYEDTSRRLFESNFESLSDCERLIVKHISDGTNICRDTNPEFLEQTTFGQQLADRVTAFGGSWTFLMLFGALMFTWVTLNSYLLIQTRAFDPYPYIFLNLILSLMSAIQAPVILMSQNRQDEKDRIAARNDYQVNLKAELQIQELHRKLDQLTAIHREDIKRLIGLFEEQIRNGGETETL
jgi:uncharacterized membrane protein